MDEPLVGTLTQACEKWLELTTTLLSEVIHAKRSEKNYNFEKKVSKASKKNNRTCLFDVPQLRSLHFVTKNIIELPIL
jgi:hypothetical protein